MRAFSVCYTLFPLCHPRVKPWAPGVSIMRLMMKSARRPDDEPSCLPVLWLGEFLGNNYRLWGDMMLTRRAGCLFIRIRVCCHGFVLESPVCKLLNCLLTSRTVRRILIDDPEFIFPPSLQQVTLYRSMQGTSELHSALAKNKMKVSPNASNICSACLESVVKINNLWSRYST